MRDTKQIIEDVAKIYEESGRDAEEYLNKARKLRDLWGFGPAIVYCWFYSVPQRWTQVETRIFEVMRLTNSFDLDTIILLPSSKLASLLKPMIFRNKIASYLKNFCKAVKREYGSWICFAEVLENEKISMILEKLRKYKAGITFKNLAAMKIFVGMNDNLLILDTHVSRVLGIGKSELRKYRTQGKYFQSLLHSLNVVTAELREKRHNATLALWSLSLWFNGSRILASELLKIGGSDN